MSVLGVILVCIFLYLDWIPRVPIFSVGRESALGTTGLIGNNMQYSSTKNFFFQNQNPMGFKMVTIWPTTEMKLGDWIVSIKYIF